MITDQINGQSGIAKKLYQWTS